MQAEPADSLIGFVLADKYRIVRQIGRGGMGVVYEAEHLQLGKRFAIKLMLEKYVQDAEATARFHREAIAASRIGNPHIIDVSDVGTAPDGRAYVVMELLTGLPLTQVLEQTGPMVPWRAIHIMRQVLRAVGAAHGKGIVHRDLKPDNIFLVNTEDQRDFVKLLDFGISKMVDRDEQVAFTKLTITGVVMGTPLYMAPEQAMGNPTDLHADIYACGVILYQMLAGRPPFDGATYAVLVAKLLTSPPPPLEDVRPGLPVALVKAVHRALEKEPTARFASAELFAASLPGERTASQIELAGTLDSGLAMGAPPPPAMPTMQRRRGRSVAIAVLAFSVAAAGTAAVLLLTKSKAPAAAVAPPNVDTGVPPDPPPKPPMPLPITGTLEVKSIPPGARVTVGAADAGLTPALVTLGAGLHHVKVELAGHITIETDEEVRVGERLSVVVPLQRKLGRSPKGGRPAAKLERTIVKTKPAAPPIETRPTEDRTKPAPTEDRTKPAPPGMEEPVDKSDDKPSPASAPTGRRPPEDKTKPNPY